jgi:hypothetical protein
MKEARCAMMNEKGGCAKLKGRIKESCATGDSGVFEWRSARQE